MAVGPQFRRIGHFGMTAPMNPTAANQAHPVFMAGGAAPIHAPTATPFTPPPAPQVPPLPQSPANDPGAPTNASWLKRKFGKAALATYGRNTGKFFVAINNFDKNRPWEIPLAIGTGIATAMYVTGTYTPNNTPAAIAEIGLTSVAVAAAARGIVHVFRPFTMKKGAIAIVAAAGVAWALPHAAPQLISHGMSRQDPYVQMVQKAGNLISTPQAPVQSSADTLSPGQILTVNPGQMLVGYTDMFKADNVTPLPWKQANKVTFHAEDNIRFRVINTAPHPDPASNNTTAETNLQPIDITGNPAFNPKTGKPWGIITAEPRNGSFTISFAGPNTPGARTAAKGPQAKPIVPV